MFQRCTRPRCAGRGNAPRPPEDTTSDEKPDLSEARIREVYRQIYASVGNREEAELLTTRVFLGEVRRSDLTRAEQTGLTWLMPVSWPTRVDPWHRPLSAHTDPTEDIAEPTAAARPGNPTALRVRRILAGLPARDREFLTARFLEEHTLEETAAQMHLTLPEALALQYHALRRAAEVNALNEALLQGVAESVQMPDESETDTRRADAVEESQPCCCGG